MGPPLSAAVPACLARRGGAVGVCASGKDGGGRGGLWAEAGAAGGAAASHAGEAAAERGEEADRLALRQISSALSFLTPLEGRSGPARRCVWEGAAAAG